MRKFLYICPLFLIGCLPSRPTSVSDVEARKEPQPYYESLGILDDSIPYEETASPQIIGSEVEDEIAVEDLSHVPKEEIPIIVNRQVEKWLAYFQGKGRKHFAKWMSRSGRYIPMMRETLREYGLPEDLVYLSMIESGFSSYAYSRARAVGQWQFIYHTGVRYGLKVNWWIDERRDPEKSTIAAAQYLKDLYDEFQHWYLAAAGYNAGEGKISRAIKRYNTDDFWEISKYRYLKSETKNYVPKLIAAAMMAKNPQKYGFTNITYDQPLSFEKVPVPKSVELKTVAQSTGIALKELKRLNPELLRGVTPPKYPNYELKVPVGMKGVFLAKYDLMPKYQIKDVITHRVRSGEALSVIAKRYGVSAYKIASFNNLRSKHRIRAGQNLKIPIPDGRPASSYKRPAAPMVANNGTYRVRSGDSFWSISRRFNLTVSQLRRMNPNITPQKLRPGHKLAVESSARSASTTTASYDGWKIYRVRNGDNLWVISRRLGLKLNDLARWNNLNPKTAVLHPGKKLRFKS